MRRETEPLLLPPLAVSAPDGPFALSLNPAALTGLTGWNVAFVHASGPNDDEAKDRGDAGYAAMPLPFGFAGALSIEHLRGGLPYGPSTQFALGGAYGRTARFSVGFTVRHIQGGPVDGATTLDLALLVRRSRFFAFSLVGYDVLGPARLVGLDGLSVPAVVLGAFSVRPLGADDLTLEGFGGVASDGRVGFGGYASVGLPRGGRLGARTTVEHFRYQRELRVVAGAELPWDRFTALGGVVLGEGYTGSPGWYAGGIVGERPVSSLPGLKFVRELDLEGPIDTRVVLGVVEALQRAAHDPRVAGVLLRLGEVELPLAYAEDLRQAIGTVRAATKPVLCALEAAEAPEIYVCSAADRTVLEPDAVVRMRPPAVGLVPVREALAAEGIEADVVSRGARGQDAHAADEQAIEEDARHRVLATLARDFDVSVADVAHLFEAREYDADRAAATPLADDVARADELDGALEEAIGGRIRRRAAMGAFGPRAWARPRRVAVVVIDGPFVDGERGEGVAARVERLARDRSVGAIVVRVDSGGGSSLAAERISSALRSARGRKPVIASVGARATSGAYLIASATDQVYANPTSVIGGLSAMFARVNGSGPDGYRPFTAEEREELGRRLALAERALIDEVAEYRELDAEVIERIEGGGFYSGDESVRIGLADHLGGFAAAVARARELGGVAPSVELSIEPPPAQVERAPEARLRAREAARAIEALERETALAIAPAVVLTP